MCKRLERQLLENDIKEARRLLEIETLNNQEEAARQERRSEAAQASLENVEQKLEELRSGGNSQLICEWLRLSRDLLCNGRTRGLSPLRARQAEIENRLQHRREKLCECMEAFDELRRNSGELSTKEDALRPLRELQAEIDDLRCGGNRWRDRLQRLLSTTSNSQGLSCSPDGPALCPAEQRLLKLQAQLEKARVEHEAKQKRMQQLDELRKEVSELEQRLERAKASAPAHSAAPPARLPSQKAKPPGPPPSRAVTPAKSLPSSRLSLPGGQPTPGSSPPASPVPGKATASPGGPSPARPTTSPPGPPGRIVGPGSSPKSGAPKAKGKPGPPPPPKGGGAGVASAKGGGKAKPPGPPLATGKAVGMKASPEVPRSNGLINVNWKETATPKEADLQVVDTFLGPLCEFSGIANNKKTANVESAFTGIGVKELTTAELQFWFASRPSNLVQLPKVSKVRGGDTSSDGPSPAQSTPSGSTPSSSGQPDLPMGVTRKTILDDKALKSAELLLQRFRMRRANTAPAVGSALAEELCRSFLQGGLSQESLGAVQTLLLSHEESGAPLTSFVQANGPESLAFCVPEAEHRLVHAISAVPGHHQRLSCLLFQHSWQEASRKCSEDLEVLHVGLQALSARRKPLQSFFRHAMKLGNALNQEGGGPVAHNGFKLSSLPTVLQTKSPKRPQLSMLHLILAQMDSTEVEMISSKLAPLAAARDRKSSGVFERCRELIMGHAKVSRDKANVKRHMIQGPPILLDTGATEASAQPDPEDLFHQRIDAFLADSCQDACRIAERVREVFRRYWDLAIFFGDPEAVYPPPKSDTDNAQDICLVFYNLGEVVAKVNREVKTMRLREELATAREGGPEAAAAFVEEVNAGRDAPLGLRKASKASRSKNDVGLPSRELVTVPDAPLMTPPCSPSKAKGDAEVASVASPCRSRASTVSPEKKDAQTSLAARRLQWTAKAKQEEDQSDVSDWESDKQTPATASSSTAAPTAASAAAAPAGAVAAAPAVVSPGAQAAAEQPPQRPVARRRRIKMPSERPGQSKSTPSSPSASSHSTPDGQQATLEAASMTPPASPRPRLGDGPPPERKSEMKMHLSKQANRISSAALGKLNLPDSPETDSSAWASCSSRRSSMSSQSCQSIQSISSAQSRGSTRLAKAPPRRPPARRSSQTSQAASLSTELRAEVHRRSLSRESTTSLGKGGLRQRRVQKAPQVNLSPVAEPGETPGSERGGPGRNASLGNNGRAVAGRQGRLSRGPPPQQPAPRKLLAAFCGSR